MSWRPHGRATVRASSPNAWGCCDRCSFWYVRRDLNWQFQYGGNALFNTWLLVCDTCLDVPQPQLKARVIPADPVPVWQPRTDPQITNETDALATNSGSTFVTGAGLTITVD